MRKTTALLFLHFMAVTATAQRVAMKPENWDFKPGAAEFQQHDGYAALKMIDKQGKVTVKGIDFSDGTIEYDIAPETPGFTAMFFRQQDDQERECFYFRSQKADNRKAPDLVQYAPYIKGVNMWDMYPEFQSDALFYNNKWNHVKLVISGKQFKAYVNDVSVPALQIPRLEGNTTHGSISFNGDVYIANVVVKAGQTEGLSPVAGMDITDNDSRYLRNWEVSKVQDVPSTENLNALFPLKETWDTITAERHGLVNLSRLFGGGDNNKRQFVWLKTKIHSATMQFRTVNLGFSDDVAVFINGYYLYMDKNPYGRPMMKKPEGRCSLENTSFELPLNAGDNELLIGVANDFYGWGIIARLDKMDGIEIR